MKMKTSTGENSQTDFTNNSELILKRQLVEATDSIRKKFRSIKNKEIENRAALEQIYEPVIKPLKEISSATTMRAMKQSPSLEVKHAAVPIKSEEQSKICSESTPYTRRDSDNDANKTAEISFMDTPSSSTFVTSPESDTSISYDGVQMQTMVEKHIQLLRSGSSKYDTEYGVRIDGRTGKLLIGKLEIRFPNGNIDLWNQKKKVANYKGSPTLYNILFLKQPTILNNLSINYDDREIQIYKEILEVSKAPYNSYDKRKGLNDKHSRKYREIIKPLLLYKMAMLSHSGHGLLPTVPTMKLLDGKGVNYVYWNKPKELVDRLRVLWSSKLAGHSGHDNEIMSLVEELREEGIIY